MDDQRAIDVQDLTKRFKNGVLANNHINLSVLPGAIFGLLGPNGAGKTTLVRQLTGELLPTSGSLRVLGIDVLRHPTEAKRVMGIVPQEAGTFDMVNAVEHLEIFGRLHGLSKQDASDRTVELLRELNLESHRTTPSYHLSGGLRRKLLLGIAVVARPRVLVLDEPTTGLDPNSRREVWSMIRALQRGGAAILLTTHYMEEAEELCDEVAILASGETVVTGSVDEIRSLSRKHYKASYQLNGEAMAFYGESHDEVVSQIEDLGVAEYSVAKTNLEDLYLDFTARPKSR